MSTAEELRHDLIEALRATIGHEQTGTLMGYLPPVGWADVATKRDLEHQEALLRFEIERVETRLSGEIERVETRLLGELETLDARMSQQRAEIVADVSRDVGTMIRNFGFTLTAAYTAIASLALGASRLL